jgi:cyclopropane fatty-acyl-phospholipid synthase-like methyltransferase
MDPEKSAMKYDQDFAGRGMALKYYFALQETAGAASVLEFGCSTGALLAEMAKRGQAVTGLEVDGEAAAAARARGAAAITGDLDTPEALEAARARGPFEALVCLDVLEHLKDPWSFLRAARGLLVPGGFLFATIPNVGFYRVRWAHLLGRFDYAEEGIMDRGHLRFFTIGTARKLLEDSGWRIVHGYPTSAPLPLMKGKREFTATQIAHRWPGLLAEVYAWRAVPR